MSNAISGVGSQFKRETATPGTYTAIAEVTNIAGPDKSRDTIDVTSLDSTGGYREFIAGFRDGGEVTLTMNFALATYGLLNVDFEAEAAHGYQIALNDTGGTTLEFDGLVTNIGLAIPQDDKVTSEVTIKISGQVTLTS